MIVIIIVYNEDGNGFTFFRHVKNLFIKHVSRWHADYDRKWRGLSALYVMFSPLLYNCPKHTLLDAHGMMDEYNYTNIIQIFTYASDDLWVYIPIFFFIVFRYDFYATTHRCTTCFGLIHPKYIWLHEEKYINIF